MSLNDTLHRHLESSWTEYLNRNRKEHTLFIKDGCAWVLYITGSKEDVLARIRNMDVDHYYVENADGEVVYASHYEGDNE